MNPDLSRLPTTDPAQILRYRDRQYAAELIAVALRHLDLFTWLAEHEGATTQDLIAAFEFAPRPADVLLTLCRANGFLTTDDQDRHQLTPLAREHLVASSPWCMAPYYQPIEDTPVTQGFLRVLRTGKPANWQARAEGDDWHASMLEENFARDFTQLMNCRGLALGQALAQQSAALLAGKRRLLDVGGGSGIYAATLVAAHSALRASVLEQPPVDEIARRAIEGHELADRVEVISGDMFRDTWPDGHDVVLLSNVLHDWDLPEVRTLLQRAHAALPAGGLLVIHEAFLRDDKTGPLPVAEYSALLMNITQGKCYTPREYGVILEELGFEVGPYQDTLADRGFMTATRPA
ncbi:MAG: methyltransferase domain-containing protein [Verrucomicrobiales bacterium]|nr:methyltransferase domain-containing protein [Verrucomicrobiales bacterium]